MVNVVNNSVACADFDAMKVNGFHHLLRGLAMNFVLIANGDLTPWTDKTGGGSHLHWTLFQYLDNCHANIGSFCADVNNANIFYTGCPDSKLDFSVLIKVDLAFKAANNHFNQLIMLNHIDSTVPSIFDMAVPSPATPRAGAEIELRRASR